MVYSERIAEMLLFITTLYCSAAVNSRRDLEQKLSQSLQDAAQVKAGDAAAVARFSGSPIKTKSSGRVAMLILKSAQGKDRKDLKIKIQAVSFTQPLLYCADACWYLEVYICCRNGS
jgi:hypothetical protein